MSAWKERVFASAYLQWAGRGRWIGPIYRELIPVITRDSSASPRIMERGSLPSYYELWVGTEWLKLNLTPEEFAEYVAEERLKI